MISDHDLALAKRAAASLLPAPVASTKRKHGQPRKLPRNVYPHGHRFRAQVTVKGGIFTIGTFTNPDDAAAAVARWRASQASPLKTEH